MAHLLKILLVWNPFKQRACRDASFALVMEKIKRLSVKQKILANLTLSIEDTGIGISNKDREKFS